MSSSSVSRDIVIAALKAVGVELSVVPVGDNWEVTLVKGDRLEVLIFPEEVEKQMLFRLKFHYGVPIHWFWNPTMIPGYEAPKVN